ncbi:MULTISPECIES: hypothetical protein [unclassified Rathayibacter]|uniref:hypothetical protein n=1 Tax=unclassified Rathayibacter TaxID=2609250 RepID=UPI000CE77F4C|nr:MULTISPECIES: hypothetical protein [unclassified Rathayibacter]PPF21610.1 hypothetical protein C5B95_04445 [Rathayibacter sp. AY1A7]PPF39302.1 hypothetical protein C5B93_04475 [Rathayibacter sp. AY1A2]PPH89713.1 hypothetical protein C5C82_07550 [Rathayibacter sp. AY1D5]
MEPKDRRDEDPSSGPSEPRPGDGPTPSEQALRAIRDVANGADPTNEAFRLSNDFTDRQAERLRSLLARFSRGR